MLPKIEYGWKCPQCNTMHAPRQGTCSTCAQKAAGGMALGGGTLTGYVGTVTMSSGWDYSFPNAEGTIWFGSAKPETTLAREAVADWRAKGRSLKALIDAAVEDLIDQTYKEDDDEDDD